MRRNSSPKEPIWSPLAAPEGYEFEIDISRPAGALRHRLLPQGQWLPGPLPVETDQSRPRPAAVGRSES